MSNLKHVHVSAHTPFGQFVGTLTKNPLSENDAAETRERVRKAIREFDTLTLFTVDGNNNGDEISIMKATLHNSVLVFSLTDAEDCEK